MATESDKKFTVSPFRQVTDCVQVCIDTSKREMLNPNQGYKKLVQKLKARYKVAPNPPSPLAAVCDQQGGPLILANVPKQPGRDRWTPRTLQR